MALEQELQSLTVFGLPTYTSTPALMKLLVIVSVSAVLTDVTGAMARLMLKTRVMILVLRAVCVKVTKVIVGVCREEHANSMSKDRRERKLKSMLAAFSGNACL